MGSDGRSDLLRTQSPELALRYKLKTMPAISAFAPGKIILFGEHAVVYGQPAIAAPVTGVHARAIVSPILNGLSGQIRVIAPQIKTEDDYHGLPVDHPIAVAIAGVLEVLKPVRIPACELRISSTIPIGAGLGSGAAVSVSIIRAFSKYLGRHISDPQVNDLAYRVEQIHHGTPSGIDNTVITYEKPVYFRRGQPIQFLQVNKPLTLLIADTGIFSPTAVAVENVRKAYNEQPEKYSGIFSSIGEISAQARHLIESGQSEQIGPLMNRNHELLQEMGVSSSELDHLVNIACHAGAQGAKLSGGGLGGNLIALVQTLDAPRIAAELMGSGAVHTFTTTIRASNI